MRLVLIVDSYPPDSANAAGRMMRELGESLVDLGHEVLLATPSPTLTNRSDLTQEGKLWVLRARSSQAKGQSHLARGLAELGFPLCLGQALSRLDWMREPVDGIIWYSPSIFFGPLIAWLKWRYRARTYLILRDIFPNWALQTGTLKPGLSAILLRLVAEFQYWIADTIAVQAKDDAGHLHHLPAAKLQVLPNWVSAAPGVPEPPDWMEEPWFLESELLVLGGALGPAQDPDNILRLATRLQSRKTCMILSVGDSDRSDFQAKSQALGLDNIVIKPGLSGPTFDLLLSKARLGLISLNKDLRTQNVPGRFLSHLNAGLPTIASLNPNNSLFDLFETTNCGTAVQNGDDEGFYRAVVRALDQRDLRETQAKHAKDLAKLFQPKQAATSILARMASLGPTTPIAPNP